MSYKIKLKEFHGKRRPPPICGVYALIDPRTGLIIYIGGSIDIQLRYEQHIYALQRGRHTNHNLHHWYESVSLLPKLEILERCKKPLLTDLESSWIQVAISENWPVLNISPVSTCQRVRRHENLKKKVMAARKRLGYGDRGRGASD